MVAAGNNTPDERVATLTVTAGDHARTLTVIQKPGDALTVSKSEFEVAAEGDQIEVEVRANIDFDYEIADEWITLAPATRALTAATLQFSVAPNLYAFAREGRIIFKSGAQLKVVTIQQTANTSESGIAVVHVPIKGTLAKILASKGLKTAVNLKITGELDNDDVGFLDEMARHTLLHLDMSEVSSMSSSVTSFGKGNLRSVILPNSLTYISKGMFFYCENLISVGLPNRITEINISAFFGCMSLTDIAIPGGVKSISFQAFESCRSLKKVILPDSLTYIGPEAFSDCSSLTNIIIPDRVTSIGVRAFSRCSGLTSIVIPNSVTEIGGGVFEDCVRLSSITIPNSVTEIKEWAFQNCIRLSSITIPNSVTKIRDGAFQNCSQLSNITIPDSVTEIGLQAFERCTGLTDVTCLAITPPTLMVNSFSEGNGILYVPAGSVEAYKASPWAKYFPRIVALSE